MNPWIQTRSGIIFDLVAPIEQMVSLTDIAHGLAHINRFTGHTRYPYSVAQHCVLCAHGTARRGALGAVP